MPFSKALMLCALVCGLFVTTTTAQDDPAASLKGAKKMLQRYIDNDKKEPEDLLAARKGIDDACKSDVLLKDPKQSVKTLMTRGAVYQELAILDDLNAIKATALKEKYAAKYPEASSTAATAYLQLLNDANAKKGDKKDVLTELETTAILLTNMGGLQFEKQNYDGAYNNFKTVLDLKKAADANGGAKILETPEKLNQLIYSAGVSGMYAKKNDEAVGYFETLAKAGYKVKDNEAVVYNTLAKLYTEQKQTEKAIAVIGEGRKLYPNDQGLLYAEINYYIAQNQLDKLEDRLEAAIKNDPNNKSLYYVKGKMYDGLIDTYNKAGKTAEAAKALENAEIYYLKATEKDAKYFEALYSLGALSYNRAAGLTQEMKAITGQSTAENARYEKLQTEMKGLFAKALPYFERADAAMPSDLGTLTALREISVKMNKMDKAKEYKDRLDALSKK